MPKKKKDGVQAGKVGSLGVNFVMNVILTMSSFIFPLITFPYISRVLLAEGNGKIQMAISFVSYFILISQLGLPSYGIRACAAVRDNRRQLSKTVQELCIIQTVTTVLSYAAFFTLVATVPKLRGESTLYLITSISIFLGSIGIEWLFRALEKYTYITVRSLIFKAISVLAMFLMVHTKSDYIIYSAITVFASYGSNLMNLTQLRKYIDLKPVGNYNIKRHLKPVFVLFAYVCATTIYTNLDSVMLGFMTTDADVGYYSVAVKIKTILVSVISALGTVVLPRVSYYFEHGETEKFWGLIGKSMKFVLLLAFPLTVFFMIFAKSGIIFLAGDGYVPSIMPMIVIMPTLLLIGITSVTGLQILIPTGRESVTLRASVYGAVADLILNAILIPSFKSTGAAIGTLVAEAIGVIVHYLVLRKEIAPIFKNMRIGVIALAVTVSSAVSFWATLLPIANFWILLIGALVFFGVYAIVLQISKEPLLLEMEQRFFAKLKSLTRKNST